MSIIIVIAAVYGLAFGSFANALAYRFPTGESLMTRSHCPKCDTMITAWMNIPVLSWLILGGKCKNCKLPISFQYPAVELLTATLFVLVSLKVSTLGFELVPAVLASIGLCFAVFMGVVLSIIDLNTKTLPTKLIYITAAVTLPLLAISSLLEDNWRAITAMIIGGLALVIPYGLMWFLRPGAMGFGDVRLVLITGAIAGWFSIGHIFIAGMSPWIIASFALIPLMILKIVKRKTKVPFGPWIIAGLVLSILCGDIILELFKTVGGL